MSSKSKVEDQISPFMGQLIATMTEERIAEGPKKSKTGRKINVQERFKGHPHHWYILDDKKEEQLRELWEQGLHVRVIAKKVGLTRDRFSYFRIKFGLKRTTRVYRAKSINELEEELIKQDYMLKKSLKFIARKYDKSLHTLAKLILERKWANRKNEKGGKIQVRSYWEPKEHAELQKRAFKHGLTVPMYLVAHFMATKDVAWQASIGMNLLHSSEPKKTAKSK